MRPEKEYIHTDGKTYLTDRKRGINRLYKLTVSPAVYFYVPATSIENALRYYSEWCAVGSANPFAVKAVEIVEDCFIDLTHDHLAD